jgi:ribonuclease HI
MASPAPSEGTVDKALRPTNAVAGTKRKRPSEKKFYAVKEGKRPGIYHTWDECLNQVRGHRGAVCEYLQVCSQACPNLCTVKAFMTAEEAQAFIDGKITAQAANKNPAEQKFYAVQNGRKPGIYLDWPSAQEQIRGFPNPRHKKFNTRAEAEAFVLEGQPTRAASSPYDLSPEEEIRHLIVRNSAPGLQANGTYQPRDQRGDPYGMGTGPLPPGAEDNFDPNIKLDDTGAIVAKSEAERNRTKVIPRAKQPPGMLRIYTDGSSLRNGTAGARAGVGVFFGPQDPKYASSHTGKSSNPPSPLPLQTQTVYTIDWAARGAPADDDSDEDEPKLTNWRYRNVSEALKGKKQTNQRAELTAIQRALDIAPKHRDVTIYTDSKYSIDCVTNWYRNWVRNGWVNSKGNKVENRELVERCREAIEEREMLGSKTFFVWVKGHAGDAGNTEADRLANEGARMAHETDGNEDGEDGYRGKTNGVSVTNSTDGYGDSSSVVGDTTGHTSLPGGNANEDEDVKRAFADMEASMDGDSRDDYP